MMPVVRMMPVVKMMSVVRMMPMVRMMRIMRGNANEFAVWRRMIIYNDCAAVAVSNHSMSISMCVPVSMSVSLPFVVLTMSYFLGNQLSFGGFELLLSMD